MASNGWQEGWECGVKWAKENYHIDKYGNPNVSGDCLYKGYLQYLDKWNVVHGFDGGFAEGIRSGLSQLTKNN